MYRTAACPLGYSPVGASFKFSRSISSAEKKHSAIEAFSVNKKQAMQVIEKYISDFEEIKIRKASNALFGYVVIMEEPSFRNKDTFEHKVNLIKGNNRLHLSEDEKAQLDAMVELHQHLKRFPVQNQTEEISEEPSIAFINLNSKAEIISFQKDLCNLMKKISNLSSTNRFLCKASFFLLLALILLTTLICLAVVFGKVGKMIDIIVLSVGSTIIISGLLLLCFPSNPIKKLFSEEKQRLIEITDFLNSIALKRQLDKILSANENLKKNK